MQQQTIRRIVWTASYMAVVVDVAAIALFVSARSGVSGSVVTVTATAVMIATLGLQATFVIAQLFPNGRSMVPVPKLGPDGWFFVITSTAIPGALWYSLAALAVPPMRLIMPGFVTPLFNCLVLLIARGMQQRRMVEVRR